MNCYIINKKDINQYIKLEFNGYFLDDLINIISSLENIDEFYFAFEYRK